MPEVALSITGLYRVVAVLAMIACLPVTADDAPLFVDHGNRTAEPRFIPRPAPQPVQQGNVLLTTTLNAGGTAFHGSRFTVMREEPDAWGKKRYVVLAASGPQATAAFELDPGEYRLQVRNGAVLIEETLEVPQRGVLHRDIALQAGLLDLNSVMSDAGESAAQTWFRVLRADTDAYGKPKMVQIAGNGYQDSATFVLPAGHYIAEASCGNARQQIPVLIEPGLTTEQQLNLDAGRLELFSSLLAGGDAIPGTDFSVFLAETTTAGTPSNQPLTHADGTDRAAFVLPAGEYIVRATRGAAAIETRIRLEPGSTVAQELPLDAGELTLMTTLTGDENPLLDAEFIVEQPDPEASPAIEVAKAGPAHRASFVLPAGDYRLRTRIGETSQTESLTIEAGQQLTRLIELYAGRVTLRMLDDHGAQAVDQAWFSVYRIEEQGKQRHRVFNDGYRRENTLILSPGRYIAFGRHRHLTGESAFEIRPGEQTTVAIVAR
jgi:hypothetical protein